jgi:hypothetical protein
LTHLHSATKFIVSTSTPRATLCTVYADASSSGSEHSAALLENFGFSFVTEVQKSISTCPPPCVAARPNASIRRCATVDVAFTRGLCSDHHTIDRSPTTADSNHVVVFDPASTGSLCASGPSRISAWHVPPSALVACPRYVTMSPVPAFPRFCVYCVVSCIEQIKKSNRKP